MAENPPSMDATADSDFLATILTRVRLTDIGLLAAVPVLLTALFQLPMTTRRSLAFNPDTPTITAAFVAHFVHFETAHLFGNLWLYLLTVPLIYLLFTLCNSRREFHVLAVPILVVLPFGLSALNLVLPRSGVVIFGFSGLAMAFVGVLPVALFRFLAERVPRSIGVSDGLGLFFLGAALIAFRMAPTGIGIAIGIGAGSIAVLLILRLLRRVGSLENAELKRALQQTGYFELAATTPIIFILATLMAFPADPYRFGGILDLTMHLFGYLLGFTLSFFIVVTVAVFSEDEVPEPPDDIEEPQYDDP